MFNMSSSSLSIQVALVVLHQMIDCNQRRFAAGPGDGIILRKGATIEHACHALHRTLASQFRYAIVWGTSTKFSPQRVGIQHKLHHEDVIQIVKK